MTSRHRIAPISDRDVPTVGFYINRVYHLEAQNRRLRRKVLELGVSRPEFDAGAYDLPPEEVETLSSYLGDATGFIVQVARFRAKVKKSHHQEIELALARSLIEAHEQRISGDLHAEVARLMSLISNESDDPRQPSTRSKKAVSAKIEEALNNIGRMAKNTAETGVYEMVEGVVKKILG